MRFSVRYLDAVAKGAQISWIRGGITVALVGYLLTLLAGALADANVWNFPSEAFATALLAVALVLSFRGYHHLAAGLTVAVVWTELHVAFFLNGALIASAASALPVFVAGAGFLLGGRAALALGIVSSLSAPLAVLLGRKAQGLELLPGGEELRAYVTLAVVLVGMAVIISLGLRYFGEIFETARRSERRVLDLISRNPDGILAVDGDGRVESLNEAAERILGIPPDRAVGTLLADLEREFGIRLTASRPMEGLPLPSLPVEQIMTRPDGRELVLEVARQPFTRPDGTPGLILVVRDLTERRNAEALATQFGRIVEEARSEIYVFHRDTLEILMANRGARENLGYSWEETRGMRMSRIQPTLTSEVARGLTWKLFEGGEEVVTLNTVHHRRDGTAYPVEIQLQKGAVEGAPVVLAFGTDVSERETAKEEQRLLQAQLLHAQKMEAVGLLAGGVAHDFNNLLTVIGGCGEILLDVGDDQVKELTGEILDAQERGAVLTRQLLAFARREIVQPEDLPLQEALEEMMPLVRRVLGERIVLETTAGTGGVVHMDRGQLEQVVLNLVANARDAMPDGGTLRISLNPDPGGGAERQESPPWVSLEIRDTGTGMDPQVAERIFEPFFTTKPRGKGTGLGLSTVHGIVSQNHGRVLVESQPGVGTTFRILLPPSLPEDAPAPSAEEVPGRPRASVLVAEDEEGARDLIRVVLAREGYRVVVARDGREALSLLKEGRERFDLLITDIVMPGLSGLELADRARELYPSLPTLFMSGYVDASLQGPEGAPSGLRLLAKPFRPAELRTRVRELLPTVGD